MQAISHDVAAKALSFISPDDRDTWIRMGMALKAEFGDTAFDTWDQWSQMSDGYDKGAARASWRSFKNGGKVGIGSLISAAKDRGFEFTDAGMTVSPEQLAADKRERDARNAKTEADRLARAQAAANRAQSQWRMAAREGASPYLDGKQVIAEACRYLTDGAIIVPMMRYDAEPPAMVGKQQINADGSKKYSGGMDRYGAACRLGNAPADGDLILVGEGYATGLSVRMARDFKEPFFVAFDTSGLMPLAKILRRLYPNSPILFCADDDYLTGDTGAVKAMAAAEAIGSAAMALPVFSVPRSATKKDQTLPKLTDFNDLQVAESLDAVREQLAFAAQSLASQPADASPAPSEFAAGDVLPPWPEQRAIDQGSPAPLDADAAVVVGFVTLEWSLAHCALVQGSTDVWDSLNKLRMKRPAFLAMVGKDNAKAWEVHKERRTISPRNLPKLARGVAVSGGAGDDNIVMMLDRYTLLYGTKTVWDAEKRVVLSYDAMALARSSDLASRWISHPLHREIDAENLVFDPTQKLSLETHVNMFQGFPLKPKHDDGKAALALALLRSLCSSEPNGDEVFCWTLRWLAYPLQNPGAKMQTALLFFGEKQGTGKSLFFEGIMRQIYGAHGATAGQHQLESPFTAWRSQKLFVLFEEILSRADKYSHFGLIKHMITGRDTRINEKNLPERVEANHLNAVMLSNEFQAIPLEPDDRRFLVVEAKNPLDQELLDNIKVALSDGLVEAFYDFLLTYPLDGFDAHTKPIVTSSKQRVIRFGLPGWDSFYQSWAADELSAPFCSCLATDLYLVYDRWCSRCGERSMSLTKFSELLATRVHKSRQHVDLGAGSKKLLMVFKVPGNEDESLSKQCQRFRDLADIKDRV